MKPELTPDQERDIIGALKRIGWQLDLKAISVAAVLTQCPEIASGESAQEIIDDLVQRGLLRQEMEPGKQLADREPIPKSRSRWI